MQPRYLSIASLLVAAVVAVSANAAPAQDTVAGAISATASSCKPIKTICELQAIGKTVASRAGYYCLASDIDASQIKTCGTGTGFQPIGTSAEPFTGRFDGKGFNIRNLLITMPSAPKDAEVGLFGHVGTSAFVHDVGLINAAISVTSNLVDTIPKVGGLAGNNEGKIYNAFVTGAVACNLPGVVTPSADKGCYLGGLIGKNTAPLRDVFTIVALHGSGGTQFAGGLVGTNSSAVTRAYAIGPVACATPAENDGCFAGGLFGGSTSEGAASIGLFATGSITVGDAAAVCGGTCWAGGLTAARSSPGEAALLQSFAMGSVSCLGESTRCLIGGLAANVQTGPIRDSYATGAVRCDVTGPLGCWIGGFVGINGGSLGGTASLAPLVIRSFAAGNVNCRSADPTVCLEGGLAAYTFLVGIVDTTAQSYWDKDTTNQPTTEGGGTGLTKEELQSGLPPKFDPAKWAISYGSSYPYLTGANRWIPAVSSPTRTFPSRTTSFWGSLALAETNRGRFAVFPVGQMFPWDYHAYDKQRVSVNSKAAVFAMLGRVIGSGKPTIRVVYGDQKAELLSLAKIDYFIDVGGSAAWPLSNAHLVNGAKFYAGSTLIADPSNGIPAIFNRHDILTQLGEGRLVMLEGATNSLGKHWMLATAVMRNAAREVTGIVANDPQLGQQVIIDMAAGSPTYRQVIEPANYQSLSAIPFSVRRYFSVALK